LVQDYSEITFNYLTSKFRLMPNKEKLDLLKEMVVINMISYKKYC